MSFEGMAIPNIVNIVKCMDGSGEDETTANIKSLLEAGSPFYNAVVQYFRLEEEILYVNESNTEEIFEKIQSNVKEYGFIIKYIEYLLKIRPNLNEFLWNLLFKISEVSRYNPSNDLLREHWEFLNKKGIFGAAVQSYLYQRSYWDRIKEEKEDCIIDIIRKDSVDKLIRLSAQNDFNPQKKLKIKKGQPIYFVTENIAKINKNKIEVSYMQFMAFYGAVRCFKYALIEGSYDDSELHKYAVAGGNNEIIHLLEQNGISFDNCFETSIKYHRYDISDWLFRNYKCDSLRLSCTIEYFNIPAFFFLLKNKISSSKSAINEALTSSLEVGFLPLAKYLIDNGANIKTKNRNGTTPLHIVCSNNNLEFATYLINKGANIEAKDGRGRTPLHIVCENNSIDIFTYLLSRNANTEARDLSGRRPLHYANENNNIDIVRILVDLGANINMHV